MYVGDVWVVYGTIDIYEKVWECMGSVWETDINAWVCWGCTCEGSVWEN